MTAGKGDTPRPRSVSREEFERRWPLGEPKRDALPAGCDGMYSHNGRIETLTSRGRPMPLLGDGCGCRRYRQMDTWFLDLCDRHSEELSCGVAPVTDINAAVAKAFGGVDFIRDDLADFGLGPEKALESARATLERVRRGETVLEHALGTEMQPVFYPVTEEELKRRIQWIESLIQ